MKEPPIGITDYKVVSSSYYYVDKTELIHEIIEAPETSAFLFSGPSHFGKSLALSMLDTFFRFSKESLSPYFANRKISTYSEDMKLLGSFPVLHLSFKMIREADEEQAFQQILSELQREYGSYRDVLLSSSSISDSHKLYIARCCDGVCTDLEYMDSLRAFSSFLHAHYKKRCIILIDGFDAPTTHSYYCKEETRTLRFLRGLANAALKGNDSLSKGVLTGVLRPFGNSIIGGLNNLIVCDVLSRRFPKYFGFSEEETKDLLAYYGVANSFQEAKKWYGGYRMAGVEVFSPSSLITFVREKRLKAYWANSANHFLLEPILDGVYQCAVNILADLLSGNSLTTYVESNITYSDISNSYDGYLSYMVANGYLTTFRQDDISSYEIGLPNQEMKEVIHNEIKNLLPKKTASSSISVLKKGLLLGDLSLVKSTLKEHILSLDLSENRKLSIFLLALVTALSSTFIIRCETNKDKERIDIVITPKKERKSGIVIGVRLFENELSSAQLKVRAQTALKQIEKMNYVESLVKAESKPILCYGFAFAKKNMAVAFKSID